jgi:hypothetical protein
MPKNLSFFFEFPRNDAKQRALIPKPISPRRQGERRTSLTEQKVDRRNRWQMALGMHNFRKLERETLKLSSRAEGSSRPKRSKSNTPAKGKGVSGPVRTVKSCDSRRVLEKELPFGTPARRSKQRRLRNKSSRLALQNRGPVLEIKSPVKASAPVAQFGPALPSFKWKHPWLVRLRWRLASNLESERGIVVDHTGFGWKAWYRVVGRMVREEVGIYEFEDPNDRDGPMRRIGSKWVTRMHKVPQTGLITRVAGELRKDRRRRFVQALAETKLGVVRRPGEQGRKHLSRCHKRLRSVRGVRGPRSPRESRYVMEHAITVRRGPGEKHRDGMLLQCSYKTPSGGIGFCKLAPAVPWTHLQGSLNNF